MRAVLLALALLAAGTRSAVADANGVYVVEGLPSVAAVSFRQTGTSLQMCVPTPGGIMRIAEGTIEPATGEFMLSYVPSALGAGGLGAYCSITITGTVAPDGSSFTATQTEYSTCVPPPASCIPACMLSATLPFTGTRLSPTPAPCCGDGVIDPDNPPIGEQCDDGNATAGDCCAPDCTAEPAGGGTCPVLDLCTEGTCDGFGHCTYAPTCAEQQLYGSKLILKRVGSREKLVWLARDPNIDVPAAGGPSDPSLAGATLELFAPFEPHVSMIVPAGTGKPGWLVQTTSRRGYKFRNPVAPGGISPVRVALLKDGRVLKVVAKRAGFPLDQMLVGVGIRLVAGPLAICSYFHVGTVLVDDSGLFVAKDAAATFDSCNSALLSVGSPSGAFVG